MSDLALEPDRLPEQQLEEWRVATRTAMKQQEISIRRLAEETQITESTLRNWLKRKPGPTLWGRGQIALALQRLAVAGVVSVDDRHAGDTP